jgi:hypothetical protein
MDLSDLRGRAKMSPIPDEPRTCLAFRYRPVPEGPFKFRVQKGAEIALEILNPALKCLRGRGFQFSEPNRPKKSFFPTAKCQVGDDIIALTARCRNEDEDEWVLLTARYARGDLGQHLALHGLKEWEGIRSALAEAVNSIQGVHELRWISRSAAVWHSTAPKSK